MQRASFKIQKNSSQKSHEHNILQMSPQFCLFFTKWLKQIVEDGPKNSIKRKIIINFVIILEFFRTTPIIKPAINSYDLQSQRLKEEKRKFFSSASKK